MEINTQPANQCHTPIESNSTLGDVFNESTYQHFIFLYFIGSLLSIIGLLAVITSILVVKPIRKHPAHLVVCRVASDLIVSITHVIFYSAHTNSHELFNTKLTDIDSICRPFSALINFGMFSGYAWCFIISVDLILAVKRPFKLHGQYLKYYHCSVWTISAILTLVFTATSFSEGSWQTYGMSIFFHCWVNVVDFEAYTIISGIIYYLPTLVLFIIGCGFGFRVLYNLKDVALFSPEIKSHITKHSFGMLFGLGVEWLLSLLIWLASIIINYVNNMLTPDKSPKFGFDCNSSIKVLQLLLTYLYAIIHSTRGCIVLLAWFYSMYTIVRAERKKRKDVENKLSVRKKYGSGNNVRGMSDSSAPNNHRRCTNESNEKSPLVDNQEGSESGQLVEYMFNKELRRYAVVCINYSILDSAKTAQSQITGDSQATIQQNVTLGQVMHHSVSSRYHEKQELRTLLIPTNFMYHKFEFIHYSPLVFKNLRDLRGIDEGEFMKSFPLQDNETTAMVEKFTEGKSGSFFFYSCDKKYIVKTISEVELKFMLRNLQNYYKYLKKNSDSLLTRYYSVLKLRFSKNQEFIYVVIMENVFYLQEGMTFEERYDLKGSIANRQTLKRGMSRPRNKTMKDMDMDGSFKINDVAIKDRLLKQLDKDTDFLRDIGAMDYSLLMGITTDCNGEGANISTSLENNVNSETEKEITIGDDTSYQWVNYKPQDLHWYRNGTHREHTPSKSSAQFFEPDAINPAESIFSHFRRGFFKIPGEKILNRRHSNQESRERKPCFLYVGLIDVLQPYDLNKKTENFLKTRIRRLKESQISAVEPCLYKARFIRSMQDRVFY